jgi:hypothetical protein
MYPERSGVTGVNFSLESSPLTRLACRRVDNLWKKAKLMHTVKGAGANVNTPNVLFLISSLALCRS